MRRLVVTMAATTLIFGGAITVGADPNPEVEVVFSFDGAMGHLPEGVGIDKRGDTYVSLGPPFFVGGSYGEIRRIDKDGSATTLVEFPTGPAPAGVAVDPAGHVYFAVPDLSQAAVGIYALTATGPERISGTENMLVPNGLALDKQGTVYATDSILGQIWSVEKGSDAASPWLTHDLLGGCGNVGANGVAIWKGDLYVANTSRGALIRISVDASGQPGTPEIVAGDSDCEVDDALWSIDGIAFDVHGQVYGALVLQNKLVRIDPGDGRVDVLLTADDGLWNPASLTFGTGDGDRKSLFIANYAVIPPGPLESPGPSILEVDVGVPGAPIP